MRGAEGELRITMPVRVVSVRRGRVVVEVDGQQQSVRAGDILEVKATVTLTPKP